MFGPLVWDCCGHHVRNGFGSDTFFRTASGAVFGPEQIPNEVPEEFLKKMPEEDPNKRPDRVADLGDTKMLVHILATLETQP